MRLYIYIYLVSKSIITKTTNTVPKSKEKRKPEKKGGGRKKRIKEPLLKNQAQKGPTHATKCN